MTVKLFLNPLNFLFVLVGHGPFKVGGNDFFTISKKPKDKKLKKIRKSVKDAKGQGGNAVDEGVGEKVDDFVQLFFFQR